jgi:lantibiotic modifying enzyme
MSSDDAFLAAAESIGRQVVAEAVWHEGRCSWMGAVMDEKRPWRAEYRALEPNIYNGTAGIGLFLAELAAATGDAAFRRTAVGAMRHAVARAPAMPDRRRDGFHAGTLGIAWAAVRVGELLQEEELRSGALAVTDEGRRSSRPDRCPDVILGGAGSIIALLALADGFEEPALADEALAAGEQLIDTATVTHHGWSWAAPDQRHPKHLCGLSHGAAGIGWALLELFAISDDERFRAGAEGAFAYERSWLDQRSGTWPDLRIGGQRRGGDGRIASPAIGTWCHGEGGIALTRLRAVDVLGAEVLLEEAELALRATRRDLAGSLPYEIEDMTLCHGAAGEADVLLCGASVLSEAGGMEAELGEVALERYDPRGHDWPSGAPGGTTPALFRGLSGIGWWFLRLHDPSIPSPLIMPLLRLTGVPA